MSSRRREPRRQLLAQQKRAAERLRREVMGADGSLSHPYFRNYQRRLRGYAEPRTFGDLVTAASLADLIYIGDFHAVPEYARFTGRLLEAVAGRVARVALGVEFVYTRQQELLDRRQAGELDDDTLLRRLHYREEWGYPWDGYRHLLDTARRLGVRVLALDVGPRHGFDGLKRRDEHAARRISDVVSRDPDTKLMVLFGETHLAPSHLPRRAKSLLKRTGFERRELIVFQNPDRLHWQRLTESGEPPEVVRVDPGAYAVFHTGPLAKYEAYRQVLERWREDVPPEEEIDLTPAVHHLIGALLGWLGIRADRRRVHHRAGWSEDLVDAFPEVYSGNEADALLEPVLIEHDRSAAEIDEARQLLQRRGALYELRSNTLFLSGYHPGAAAGEGARFLRAALTGRLFIPPEEVADDPAERAYGAAFNEAVAYLGSRLVDPASTYLETELVGVRSAAAGTAGTRVEGHEMLAWHAEFERSRRRQPPAALVDRLRESRPLRRQLARDLGRRLGRVLYERVRTGELDRRGLRRLFTRSLDPHAAGRRVIRLLRGR